MSRKPNFSLNDDRAGAIDCLRKGVLRKDEAFRRRSRALLLVTREGKTRKEAAAICEASVRSVYNWQSDLTESGIDGLVSRKKPGRTPGLNEGDLVRLKDIVKAGPMASGFDTGIWNARLVGRVIEKEFGRRYSERHVRHLLGKAGCSLQVPKKTSQGRPCRSREVAE